MTPRPRILALSALVCVLAGQRPALAQWQLNGTPVCIGTWGKPTPAMVPDGSGGAFVVWEDDRSGTGRIFAQRLDAAGVPQWAANGVPLDLTRAYPQTGCVVATDNAGGAIVAWIEYTGSNDVIYAQRINSAGAGLWTTSVCGAAGERRYLSMVSDGRQALTIGSSGGVVIVWNDDRYGTSLDTDVFAQHVDGDGNANWTADGVPVSTAAGAQWSPVVVTDGLGSLMAPKSTIVAWSDTRTDPGDVYAQRLSTAGAPQWTANGMPVCVADSIQDPPAATLVGSGNVVLCWSDRRNGTRAFDLFAQRVGSGGPWPASTGVPVCVAPGRSTQVQLVPDLKGGAIAGWTDDRNGGIADIYAQRLDPSGAALWTTNGVRVTDAPSSQSLPVMVTDIASGAIIAWTDYRQGSESDIYADRIDSTGVSRWAANGVRLCGADGSQTTKAIVGDGSAGAIVLWEDGRSVGPGLYAQHVTATGGALAVRDRAPTDFRLSAAPNPTSASVSLRFELPSERRVSAEILGVDGRLVRTLANGDAFTAGAHGLVWDGRDATRGLAPCGVYFVRMRAGRDVSVRRLLVCR